MKNFVNLKKLKKSILLAFILLFTVTSAFAEDEKLFIAIDIDYRNGDPEYRGVHFVIDDSVNVRSEPNLNGKKLFKLNTGDKIQITEYSKDWDWILAEGLWSPWYKISCAKGEGYVCARYISTKQVSFDIDFDGRKEIFACLTVCHSKDTPICEYKMSGGNLDRDFVIIDGGKRTPVDFTEWFKKWEIIGFGGYSYYSFVRGEGLSPAVCFLVVSSGFGDAGSGESKKRYFYFSGGKLRHFLTLESEGDMEGAAYMYLRTEELEFPGNNIVRYIGKSEEWRDGELRYRTKRWTTYTWNGTDFKELRSDCESEGEDLH